MIRNDIIESIRKALQNLGISAGIISLEHPSDLSNGDYSTNVAMAYAKQSGTNPRALAEQIKTELEKELPKEIEKVEVAGAGFINFYLSRQFFADSISEIVKQNQNWGKNTILVGKKVMVEYTQPNPFKPFHIGHLMSNAIGESISRVVEFSGAKTIRANYQGDVGLHVAKAIYGLQKFGMPDTSKSVSEQAQYIGEQYAKGSDEYENNPEAKTEIDAINKKVYDHSDEKINEIYDWGRKVTLDAFEEIYKILGTKFDHYFFESEMALIGEKIVRANVPNVFEESEGAIVFHAEKYNPKLHTRVFITSGGIPLYEAKEIGLTMTKFEKENPDLSITTTAIEQGEYMKVVQQAISLMHPELESRMKHITHGMMRLATGKMSSRKGNVITGESLLRDSMDIVREKVAERELSAEEKETITRIVGVSALKYSILRSSLGSDIVYDFEKSISFDGDSGPYLQYTAVRAQSIIKKAEAGGVTSGVLDIPEEMTVLERTLYRFPEVISHSYTELEPHHIATYLTELASAFNSFYANTVIIDKDNSFAPYRVLLVEAFHQTMKNGLWLLGIETPEKM
ncbi:MAG: arginine--tRNA ligase [Candidatus Pacebacteria bacterium]|jgi:arginyl-tRNA synthetase|nr:arginine--tRNA ligase [Candidatus Paceibacterota bacterium]